MRKVLLDFPWAPAELLDSYSPASGVLLQFQDLIAKHLLDPVPFLSESEYSELFVQLQRRRPAGGNTFQRAAMLLGHCVRRSGPGCLATPIAGPADLRESWRFALREVMGNIEDWRTPQILFPEVRRESWQPATPERGIRFEHCDPMPESGPYQRVLVCLEDYESHRFAACDFDPWDLRWMHPPEAGAPAHQQHPCRLPKPPICEGLLLEDLAATIQQISDWHIGDKYFFVPPRNWRPDATKERWREWRAFHIGRLPDSDRLGPMDHNGHPWWWDETHRHWDVQFGPREYWSISHTGELIRRHG